MDMNMMNAQQGAEPQEPQGTTICITKKPDGTFQVYPESTEGGEDAAAEDQEAAAGKTVKTIDEALAAAREMLSGDDGGMSVEEAFRGGFQGTEVPRGGMGGGY